MKLCRVCKGGGWCVVLARGRFPRNAGDVERCSGCGGAGVVPSKQWRWVEPALRQ